MQFASRLMKCTKKRCTVGQLEIFGVVGQLKQLSFYTLGKVVFLLTDHHHNNHFYGEIGRTQFRACVWLGAWIDCHIFEWEYNKVQLSSRKEQNSVNRQVQKASVQGSGLGYAFPGRNRNHRDSTGSASGPRRQTNSVLKKTLTPGRRQWKHWQ